MDGFDEAATPIRKRIKLFETGSLLRELIKYLQQSSRKGKKRQVEAPWVTLLAIDWVLELKPFSGKRSANQKDVKFILDRIWRTQHIAVGIDKSPLTVQIRALFAPQAIFQKSARSMVFFYLRMRKIIDAEPASGKQFKEKFLSTHDVDFETFYEITFMLCIYCMTEKTRSFSYSTLVTTLVPFFKIEDVARTVNVLSCTLSDLVKKAARNPGRRLPQNEYFKESLFLNSPLLLTEGGLLVIHSTMAMIGVSESLLRNFIREHENNRGVFTKCFEEYLHQINQEFDVRSIREKEIKGFYPKGEENKRKVADFILLDDNVNIFIDAKGVDPNNIVLSATSKYQISRRINSQHVKAIRQIIDTIDVLASVEFELLEDIENRFGLVVTHQEFFLGTGDRILSFLSDDLNTELKALADENILFSNIHFMTIDQYEKLLCVVHETSQSFQDFFIYVRDSESDGKKMKLMMDQYIEDFCIQAYDEEKIPDGAPSLISEKERVFELALGVISENGKYWRGVGKKGDGGIDEFIDNIKRLKESIAQARSKPEG